MVGNNRMNAMSTAKLVIEGGGLAGMSAGCCARASGFDVTLVEHNIETAAATVLASLDRQFPGLAASVRMTDLATPLTY